MRLAGEIGGTILVVVAVGITPVFAAGATAERVGAVEQVGVTADVEYTCRNVTVDVEPRGVIYDLIVYYEDTVVDREGKALVGPMQGRTVEPYGGGILFTRVEVLVNGRIVETEDIPARCYPDRRDDTYAGRSEIGIDATDSGGGDRSRNPVPVATATT